MNDSHPFPKTIAIFAIFIFAGVLGFIAWYFLKPEQKTPLLPPFKETTQPRPVPKKLTKKVTKKPLNLPPAVTFAPVPEPKKEQPKPSNTILLKRISKIKDSAKLAKIVLDTQVDDTARNEALSQLRMLKYPNLIQDILKVLNNPEEAPRFRGFCVQHLYLAYKGASKEGKETILTTFQKSLADRHLSVRRESLLALVRLKDLKGISTAIAWLKAENTDSIKDLSIRCIRDLNLREYIPEIRKLTAHKNVNVQVAALNTLAHWEDNEAKGLFEKALKSENTRLLRAGKAGLKSLNGKVK